MNKAILFGMIMLRSRITAHLIPKFLARRKQTFNPGTLLVYRQHYRIHHHRITQTHAVLCDFAQVIAFMCGRTCFIKSLLMWEHWEIVSTGSRIYTYNIYHHKHYMCWASLYCWVVSVRRVLNGVQYLPVKISFLPHFIQLMFISGTLAALSINCRAYGRSMKYYSILPTLITQLKNVIFPETEM